MNQFLTCNEQTSNVCYFFFSIFLLFVSSKSLMKIALDDLSINSISSRMLIKDYICKHYSNFVFHCLICYVRKQKKKCTDVILKPWIKQIYRKWEYSSHFLSLENGKFFKMKTCKIHIHTITIMKVLKLRTIHTLEQINLNILYGFP